MVGVDSRTRLKQAIGFLRSLVQSSWLVCVARSPLGLVAPLAPTSQRLDVFLRFAVEGEQRGGVYSSLIAIPCNSVVEAERCPSRSLLPRLPRSGDASTASTTALRRRRR